MKAMRSVIAIVGPTASGKSALAMRIAKKYGGEIIAADSRTVYRDMDIGTAKPSKQDRLDIPHHLLDVVNPDEPFSVAEFKRLAVDAIDDIQSRGKLPILVGGTGLYVDAVLFDYQFNQQADPHFREKLQELSVGELQEICRQKNISIPVNSQNKRHLIRAIETDGQSGVRRHLRDNTLVVGITTTKDKLRDRIEKRVHEMVAEGVVDEVERIGKKYHWKGEALKGNIYRIFKDVKSGDKTLTAATQELIQSDLQLAKRQMTWFRRHAHIVWSENPDELLAQVDTFLKQSH